MTDPPAGPIPHRQVARGAASALFSRMGSLVEAVSQPAYLALFGLPGYGLYTTFWSAVNVAENVFDLGMTSALQRTVPQARDEAEAVAALRAALAWSVGPCAGVALLTSLLAHPLSRVVNAAPADQPRLALMIALFAWALPLWAFVEVGTSSLRARRAFGPEIRLRIMWEQLIRLPVAAALWAAGLGTLGLMVAHLVSLTATALLCLRLIGRYYDLRLLFSRATPASRPTLLAGLSVLPANIVQRLFTDLPPVVLNAWFPGAAGAAAAGLYGVARKLTSLVQMIRIALSYVTGPLASAAAREDVRQVEPLYAYGTRLATVLAMPIAAVIVAGQASILPLFKQAAAAGPLLAPLCLARVVDAVTGPGSAIQQVASRRRDAVIGTLPGLLVSVALTVRLLPSEGALGMALAIAAGLSVNSLVVAGQLLVVDGLNPFRAPYPRVLGTAAAVSLAAAALTALIGRILPSGASLAALVVVLLAALWASARMALPLADRQSFGKAAVRLRLLPPR